LKEKGFKKKELKLKKNQKSLKERKKKTCAFLAKYAIGFCQQFDFFSGVFKYFFSTTKRN